MKTKLLLLLLFITSLTFSQTLPSGHYGMFEFTNGSLTNGSTNGGPDLIGTPSQITDRNGNPGNALGPSSGALTGHTLGAANYNNTTLSFWMKNSTIQSNFSQRVIQMYGTGGNGYKLEIGANSFVINAKNSSGSIGQFNRNLTVNLSDGVWHHVVVRTTDVSIDSSVIIEVFIDNVLQQSIAGSIGPYTSGASNTFIKSAQMIINPTNTYLGSIDDVYLYKSALTDAEISNIYNYTPVVGTNPTFVRYVNANASGNNTGTSWTDAHTDLQSALASASSGNEIWIAQGTYSPAISSRSTYFDISRANLKIYGGFVGTEASIDDRIIGAYPTTLSGDLQNNDVNVPDFIGTSGNYGNTTRNTDNSYFIVNITSEGENLLLDGLTISDSHTNINAATHGGAILKHASVANLTLRNCIIKDNVSRNYCAGLNADFSLPNSSSSNRGSLVIDRCKFTNNMSRIGSGIYAVVRPNTHVDITITNSVFDTNLAGDLNTTNATGFAGSAMWLRSSGSNSDANFNLYNNTFVNNIDIGNPSSDDRFRAPVIIANHGNFTNNIANATVTNSIFWNNTGKGDHASTGGLTRAISDMSGTPITSLNVYNSLDPLNFVEGSITSSVNTITTDPLFTDAANGDYTLTAASPAVDSGDGNYSFGTIDLLGNQRVVDMIDMGAYEFDGVIPCTVNVPDINFKAYLVGNTNINTNGDTEIQCSEATAFAGTINVNNGNISDLTGIEAFTSLNQLRCGGNSLTILDVSQNTALTQLHCGYNSLSSIDVSNNLSLIILAASNNQLTNISVTANTQLAALRVGNNLIGNVDLSSNSSLVALEIYNNQFSVIDISANTNLIHLYVQNNNITSLDVSSHSALNYLDVSNNDLTSLKVANGNNINFYDASNGGGSGNPAMDARQNPNLSCIQIDAGFTPPNSPSSSRWEKDATASYNANCASLGVNDFELNTITIYPNPVNNTLNIELENTLNRVEVYNLQGQKLFETKENNFNVSNLSTGVYLLKVYTENGNIGIKRFVKN